MVQSIVEFDERRNRIINIVKGKYGLKNKNEALTLIVDKFEEAFLEPELRPEYVERLSKIKKEKFKTYSRIDELRKEIKNV
jgi:hypothetical protein